ncbi:circumsporozoite protein-like [Branchiostoma floridae]|nr:circumsporozoite protein-like [Branchiostoma floridae]
MEVRGARLSAKKQHVHKGVDDGDVPPPLPPKPHQPPKKYEDVDPHGESILALSSGPKQKRDKRVDDRNVPPPLPARNLPPSTYEDVDPHGDSILALSSGPKQNGDKRVDGRNVPPPLPARNLPPNTYEDVDPNGDSVIVLGSGLQRAVPKEPLPRKRTETDKENELSKGRNEEEANRKYEDVDPVGYGILEESKQACRKNEGLDLGSSGVNVILNSGLKRALPDLPPPRKLGKGDDVAVCPMQNDESCSDPFNKPGNSAGH